MEPTPDGGAPMRIDRGDADDASGSAQGDGAAPAVAALDTSNSSMNSETVPATPQPQPEDSTSAHGEQQASSSSSGGGGASTASGISFEPMQCVGRGGEADVVLARMHHKGRATPVVLKIPHRQSSGLVREQTTLKGIGSTLWCVRPLYSLPTRGSSRTSLVMEYVPGGDLMSVLEKFGTLPEKCAAFYGAEIAVALREIHRRGYMHRDIKPDNVLLDSTGHIKLVDFGFSASIRDEVCVQLEESLACADREEAVRVAPKHTAYTHRALGTHCYMSPELHLEQGCDYCTDFWSLGVVMFEMLFGYQPFNPLDSTKSRAQILDVYKHGDCSKILPPQPQAMQAGPADAKRSRLPAVSEHARDLLCRLLCHPSRRIHSFAELQSHPFFVAHVRNWGAIVKREARAPYMPKLQDPFDAANFRGDLPVPSILLRGGAAEGTA